MARSTAKQAEVEVTASFQSTIPRAGLDSIEERCEVGAADRLRFTGPIY